MKYKMSIVICWFKIKIGEIFCLLYGGLDTITANKDLHYIDFGESLRDFNEVIKTRKHGDMSRSMQGW